MREAVDGAGLKVHAAAPDRRRVGIELAIGYGLILLVIWTPRTWQTILSGVLVLFILGVLWRNFRGWASMGMQVKNLARSSWVVAVSACIAGVAVLIAGRMGTLHAPETMSLFIKTYLAYAIWSFVQQLLLLDFFLGRLVQLVESKTRAVIGTAGVFALAHLPNPVLTPVTLIGGAITCLIFLHYRNLYVLGLSHAILGIAIACTFPGYVTHNMRVGLGYVRYQPQVQLEQAAQPGLVHEPGVVNRSMPRS
jgi:hypothetical protein